jgi:hypothetical protein
VAAGCGNARGDADVAAAAGIAIVGGHSIDDPRAGVRHVGHLPTSTARMVSLAPNQTHRGDTRLRITFDVDGRGYWYFWPE